MFIYVERERERERETVAISSMLQGMLCVRRIIKERERERDACQMCMCLHHLAYTISYTCLMEFK